MVAIAAYRLNNQFTTDVCLSRLRMSRRRKVLIQFLTLHSSKTKVANVEHLL